MILNGLVEFKATHNESRAPCNLAEYDILRDHLLSKKSITGDFDRIKLSDKVRKLRSKFLSLYNNKNIKNRKNGVNLCGYERVLYDLGRKIWVNGNTKSVDGEEVVREIDSDGLKNSTKHVNYLDGDDDDVYTDDDDCIGGKKEKKIVDVDDGDDSAQGVLPPCAVLKNVVKNLEKNDELIMQGTLKLALQMMKPERQKAWDEKWTNQCLVETQAFKKRKVLEKNLVEELEEIFIKTNQNLT